MQIVLEMGFMCMFIWNTISEAWPGFLLLAQTSAGRYQPHTDAKK